MMEETKEVLIEYEGKQEKVVIKRLTFGEKAKYEDASAETILVNNRPQIKIKRAEMKIQALMIGIKTAPFGLDRTSIEGLSAQLGHSLFDSINEFNTFDDRKKEDSSGNLKQEQKPLKTPA